MQSNDDLSILVAILGARMRYAVPVIFSQKGLLAHFYTDFYYKGSMPQLDRRKLGRYDPRRLQLRLTSRRDDRLKDEDVTSLSTIGILYAAALQSARTNQQRDSLYSYFSKLFATRIGKKNWHAANAFYATNTAAYELFKPGKEAGITCILEQINAPLSLLNSYRTEEGAAYPGWQNVESDKLVLLCDREELEWLLSDGILCGSQFVANGLINKGIMPEKCFVVPYTVDSTRFTPSDNHRKSKQEGDLKILFVGRVDLIKGIQYLFTALKLLDSKRISVRVVGHIALTQQAIHQLEQVMQFEGLQPGINLPDIYRWADVLVLPTLFEGSALVTYEALASGLPVITTNNAGSMVRDGVNGFIVPIRDSVAIADRLQFLIDDPEELAQLSQQARKFAEDELSWDAYSHRLITACKLIQGSTGDAF